MERSRETRRSNMATSNGFSKRRQRSTNLRDSPEEEGQIEFQETVARVRERANKRERDRDLLNRSKRRRGREEGEESTEDSFGDEDEYEAEDGGGGGGGGGGGPSKLLSPNSNSPSSFSNQNHRKISLPARLPRQTPPPPPPPPPPLLKVSDEIISVPVPRKARSACVKRSHEYWSSGNGGFGEDQNQNNRRASTPTLPSVSIKKKTKPNGPKTRLPKVSKSSSSVRQEDIEIEIAEVLFGLKKQSQSSNGIDNYSSRNLESKDTNGISHDAKSPQTTHQASILPLNHSSVSDPFHAQKKKKVEAENSFISVQDSSIASTVIVESEKPAKMDSSSPKLEKISGSNVESNDASMERKDSKPSIKESGLGDGSATKEESILPKDESASKSDVDLQDSTVTKAISNVSEVRQPQGEDKFKFDLMASPPPTASSPEREGFIDLASDPKPLAQNVEMKTETLIKDEVKVEDRKGKKIETVGEKKGLPKHDFEKLNKDSGSVNSSRLQQLGQKQQQLPKVNISKLERTAQSSSVPLAKPVAGWPSSVTPLGYIPSFQTIMPTDSNTGSSAALQTPQFLLSQPRPKTCSTHHYIARNICLHQQFTKTNNFWPAATSSASLAKPGNLNVMPSTENVILGNPLQGSFPVVNLNSVQDKAQSMANIPGLAMEDKSSEAANFMDTAQRKQLMLQHAPQPASAGNLLHGPAFIFPLSQQQATIAAATNQSGLSKSVTSTNNAPSASNSAAGIPATSKAFPAVAAAVSFNYPNLATNDAPYLTILPNNGYPFPISTPVGTPTQALPLINGSFYSPQMFHPQLQHQQPHSQPLVQPAHQNASTSSGSSSYHKQPQTQQPRGAQVSGNNYLTSASMQLQQPQKQHVSHSHQSRKLEAEISRENTPSVTDNRASHTQRSPYGQNFTMSLQSLNFAFMPPTTSGGGNQGEKQQQQQQQQQPQLRSLKGGVELIPSQPFAMSFFNGCNTASNLNFSSMAQNHAIFQSFPDMARQGYQVASAPEATQQKNHQVSEGKTGGSSTNLDDGKKSLLGKSPGSNGQTLVFDNSARTLNFVSSPVTGNWPPHAITSTATTTYSPSANSSNNAQQQLQKQQQMQHTTGAAQSKAPATNNLPSSSIAPKFSNTFPVSSQTLIQCNTSAQSPQRKNSARTHTPTSISASNTPTSKNVSQQQVRAPQGHTQLSFAGNSKSAALSPQGQQIPPSNQSPSPLVVGSPPSGGNLRSNSTGNKGGSSVPTLHSQQTENSSASTSQKSSPVCGRNVPSILSTCSGQLSELKY